MNNDGSFNRAKGEKIAEEKVKCSWAFVECNGTELKPTFRIFILTKQQVIDMIVTSEEWYLTDCGQKNVTVSPKGDIGLLINWLHGESSIKRDNPSCIFNNPINGQIVENNWDNIWID
ncbi:MAG: hypothetical protein HDS44_02400 [Bacteroides sp.]|nr:hypothetical protein [Bacteroides sp.]